MIASWPSTEGCAVVDVAVLRDPPQPASKSTPRSAALTPAGSKLVLA
jgi:hypothetical protein